MQPFWYWKQNFQNNLVDAMAADALAPCLARPSSTIVLSMQDKWNLGFHKEGFQLPVPSHCWEMIESANILFAA